VYTSIEYQLGTFCGATHDRDVLAANNIVTFALTKLNVGWGAANKKEST